jgi:hypothetical protein
VSFKVKFSEEIIRKERFNPLNHLSTTVLVSFKEWKKSLDVLVEKIGLDPALVTRLGLDDIP